MNPATHYNKLEETIKKLIEKSNLFSGNPNTELTQWFDLVSKLICLDHRQRYTAEKALEHPFFSEEPLACSEADLLPSSIKNDQTNDFHEFMTKAEKNKKKDYKKTFTFKHNLPQETQ